MENKFKELYYMESIDVDRFTTKMENNLLFCGRNWWFYFTSKVSSDCEVLENVELVKWDFSKKNLVWIDYDMEQDLNLIYNQNG